MALCDRLEAAQQRREQHRTHLTAATWQGLVSGTEPETTQFALAQLPALTTRKEQIAALRQTILDLAVRGRLVKQDERDEPAEVLLKRIANEKERLGKEGTYRRQKPLPKNDAERAPFEIPSTWEWSMLGAVTNITQGFAFSSGDFTSNSDEGMPLIKIGDIGSNTPEVFVKGKYDRDYVIQPGELLLGLSGSIKCATWNGPPALLNQRIARIAPIPNGFNEQWLVFCVEKAIAIWISETSKLTVQNVKAAQLYEAYVPAPPLPEQHRIVAKVEALMALCDKLEAALEKGEAAKARLLEAVLARSDDQMIGRSDDGMRARPSGERLIAKAVPGHGAVKTPRAYAEVEVALPMAAEPVPQRRGPGRPRKAETQDLGTVTAAITGFLQAHPGWHARSAIVPGAGIAANTWNAAINALLEAGKVERQGKRKGARYRVKK